MENELVIAKTERDILSGYVPTQLTEPELRYIINGMIERHLPMNCCRRFEAHSALNGGKPPNLGLIMKEMKLRYNNFDGKMASSIAKEILG